MNSIGRSIGTLAARGVAWTAAGQLIRQVVQVVGSVALARLLSPDDFGLLGMALIFVGVGQLLADFGIGSALVHDRESKSDPVILSTCFWLNLAVSVLLAILIAALAPVIAGFFGRSDLAPITALLSVNLVVSGLLVVPQSMLYRDMRFADLAYAQVGGSFVGLLTAVSMAWNDLGVWALVVQPIAGNLATGSILYFLVRWAPSFNFSYSRVRHLLHFSGNVMGTSLLSYAQRSADGLLIGRFLNAHAVGLYSQATQIMLLPLQQVSSVVVRVLFPTLVQLQADMPRFRKAYLKSVSAIALITFPLMTGLFALSDDFIIVVLGPGWTDMAPLLRVLSWVGMMQSIATTTGTLFLGSGNAAAMFRVSLVVTPVIIGGISAGTHWGIEGVAIGYALGSFSTFFYSMTKAMRLVNLQWMDLARSVWRPFACSIAMLVGVIFVHAGLGHWSVLSRFVTCVLAGVAIYSAGAMVLLLPLIRDLASDLRGPRAATEQAGT